MVRVMRLEEQRNFYDDGYLQSRFAGYKGR